MERTYLFFMVVLGLQFSTVWVGKSCAAVLKAEEDTRYSPIEEDEEAYLSSNENLAEFEFQGNEFPGKREARVPIFIGKGSMKPHSGRK